MIGGIPCPEIAMVGRFVIRMLRRKRAEAERGQQFALDHVNDGGPAFWREHRMIERDGEDLVGAAGGIIITARKAVDDVVKMAAVLAPEARVE